MQQARRPLLAKAGQGRAALQDPAATVSRAPASPAHKVLGAQERSLQAPEGGLGWGQTGAHAGQKAARASLHGTDTEGDRSVQAE